MWDRHFWFGSPVCCKEHKLKKRFNYALIPIKIRFYSNKVHFHYFGSNGFSSVLDYHNE